MLDQKTPTQIRVHDRPCSECHHAIKLSDGWICKRHFMAITADMRVTYCADLGAGWQHGLCFQAKPPSAA